MSYPDHKDPKRKSPAETEGDAAEQNAEQKGIVPQYNDDAELHRVDTRRPNAGLPGAGSPHSRGPNRRPADLGPDPASSPVMPTAPGAKTGKALRDEVDARETRTPDVQPKIEPERTLNHRPDDPNRAGADINFPPGVEPEVARDPGAQTPGAPKVDNRS